MYGLVKNTGANKIEVFVKKKLTRQQGRLQKASFSIHVYVVELKGDGGSALGDTYSTSSCTEEPLITEYPFLLL